MDSVKYIHSDDVHNTRAAKNFLPYLYKIIKPKSVVDIGCGLGTWLAVFKANGCDDVLGIDGPNVDTSKLAITKDEFLAHDLTKPIVLDKKYDLVISLEVAEHIPEEKANMFIDTLTQNTDNIVFSAALPGQSGQNHVNEQPFMYWVKKFNDRGFIVKDLFRNTIWNNEEIDWWYRQNIFFVEKTNEIQQPILDFYHPAIFLHNIRQEKNIDAGIIPVRRALKIFWKTVLRKMKGQ